MAARKKTSKTRSKAPSAAKKAASAAAKGAKRAVPGPRKAGAKPNPALKKFSAALAADPKLRKKLLAPMTNAEFHAATVKLGAALGYRFTTAESKWHVAETRRLAAPLLGHPSPWDVANPGKG